MEAKILTFKSGQPLTPFSPNYEYHIIESEPMENEYMVYLEQFILKMEPEIIRSLPSNLGDGNTYLGQNSLTSRYNAYNFFKCAEFNYLLQNIKELTRTLLDFTGNESFNEPIYGQCWANVMRSGEQIVKHQHCSDSTSFLSGHLTVKPTNSYTYYCNRYDTHDKYVSNNVAGKVTLFPAWVEHGTSKVEEGVRITVAFDLIPETCYNFKIANEHATYVKEHWVKI